MKLIIALVILAGLLLLLLLLPRLAVGWFGPSKPSHIGVDEPTDGLLHACPKTPNCFRTQLSVSDSAVSRDSRSVIERIELAVTATNGQIELRSDNYLHATFKSRLLGYIDDFECLVSISEQQDNTAVDSTLLHCRSASRIGHSDFGVNKKRVTTILQTAGFKPPV